jgi:hypothetical protein
MRMMRLFLQQCLTGSGVSLFHLAVRMALERASPAESEIFLRLRYVYDNLKLYQRRVPLVPILGPGKARARGTKLCCQRPMPLYLFDFCLMPSSR